MKEKLILDLVKQIYENYLRDFLIEKAADTSTPIDDYALKALDFILGVR